VLQDAARKLRERGEALWDTAEVSDVTVGAHVRDGMYHVAADEQGIVGVFRFQLEDPFFWPEIPPGTSAFVHKLAVHPERQGHGYAQALLHHACDLARQQERQYLRLDCMSGRPGLRAVYERFGFRHHSQKQLGKQVFDRFEFDVRATA
jgi:GNAT superfamily N-acetyltransferase